MAPGRWWFSLCALWILVAQSSSVKQCLNKIMINVILLNDEGFPWSLKYVEPEILRAIEKNADINAAHSKARNYDTRLSKLHSFIFYCAMFRGVQF